MIRKIHLPERSFVLQLLGISKEQDDAMQLKFANTNSNVNDVDLPTKRERQKGYSAKYYKLKKLS